MKKIWIILQREYLTRVKKKSFIIMTLLSPVLFAAIMIIPSWLAVSSIENETRKVLVIDESGIFKNQLNSDENFQYTFKNISLDKAKNILTENTSYTDLLFIPPQPEKTPAELYYNKQPSIIILQKLEKTLEDILRKQKMIERFQITPEELKKIETNIQLKTIKRDETGQETVKNNQIPSILGFILSMMIYMFIFLYGVQVMRGVIEEKTNRIVEIIISSVRPFQLMMGKIIGIALVGLTQIAIWIVLTLILVTFGQALIFSQTQKQEPPFNRQEIIKQLTSMQSDTIQMENLTQALAQNPETKEISKWFETIDTISNLPIAKIFFGFLFYFLFGYLIYAALFAAIGSAVDNQEDTQQFILPVTIPLVLAIVLGQFIVMNPDSDLAFWLSLFPLTSPVIMMIRIPFDVPTWQILLSAVLLILGFLATTWLAGKIYRTGILMYGKKPSYKELWKWIRYS